MSKDPEQMSYWMLLNRIEDLGCKLGRKTPIFSSSFRPPKKNLVTMYKRLLALVKSKGK